MANFRKIQIFNVYEKKEMNYSNIKLYQKAFSVRKNVLDIMQLLLRYCVRLYSICLYRVILKPCSFKTMYLPKAKNCRKV